MSVFKTIEIDQGDGWICIWKINENLLELENKLQNNCLLGKDYHLITHQKKKSEYLASRCALFWVFEKMQIVDYEINKDANGKPFFKHNPYQLSISHSGEFCVVIVHRTRNVGIDIQFIHHKIQTVSHKFLSNAENEYLGNDILKLCKAWCAKEAMYKLVGKKGLSIKDNFYIISAIESNLIVEYRDEFENYSCTQEIILFDRYVLAYAIK